MVSASASGALALAILRQEFLLILCKQTVFMLIITADKIQELIILLRKWKKSRHCCFVFTSFNIKIIDKNIPTNTSIKNIPTNTTSTRMNIC